METGMLHLHSILRYLIILVALWAIINMAAGLSGKKPFTGSDKRPALLFLILMDLQLLVGLFLYFFGPMGWKLIQSSGMPAVMDNDTSRFFGMEHGVGMLIALILVHIGYAATKKGSSDKKKFSRSFWMFLIAFLIILAFIPWPFRESLGRGWMPS
jgi:hypothetical protein